MEKSFRRAWREIVTPQDYDAHMARVGQAQVNAALLRDMFAQAPLPRGGSVLVASAGTGQMFDFVDAGFLARNEVTFSDLNPIFLRRLAQRLAQTGLGHTRLVAARL